MLQQNKSRIQNAFVFVQLFSNIWLFQNHSCSRKAMQKHQISNKEAIIVVMPQINMDIATFIVGRDEVTNHFHTWVSLISSIFAFDWGSCCSFHAVWHSYSHTHWRLSWVWSVLWAEWGADGEVLLIHVPHLLSSCESGPSQAQKVLKMKTMNLTAPVVTLKSFYKDCLWIIWRLILFWNSLFSHFL